MQRIDFSCPAVPTCPPVTLPAPAAASPARRITLCAALALTLALSACGGSNDNKDCGSAGNTRDLHCAP